MLLAPIVLLTALVQTQPRTPAPALSAGEHPLHLVDPLPRLPLPKPAANALAAVANNNRTAAGAISGRVLTLTMDVVSARWKPEGDADLEVPVLAFAERGKAPSVPGPLVRVRVGTELRLMLTNRTDSALVIGGLRAGTAPKSDTVHLAAGATREVRARFNSTGTYAYWGAFKGTTALDRNWLDSQLNGAIVVDAPTAKTDDYVFLISEWFYPYDDRRQTFEVATVINGKGFPNTQRLTLPQGDSVRFHVVNTTSFHHPMHLHGFYYRIEERAAKRVPANRQLLSNTDLVPVGSTEVFSFVPSTPGNWVFHCHFAFHVDETVSLIGSPRDSASMQAATMSQVMPTTSGSATDVAQSGHSMHGLVIAMQVTPKAGYTPPSMANARTIRLHVQNQPHRLVGGVDAIGFVAQNGDSVPALHTVSIPAPVLELERGKPVRIVVKNNLTEPTSVHWHGLEIESFPDGVPNWSGLGSKVYTQIASRDSFVAEFVPPRAGTFPYHSHLNDRQQMLSGMYGAIIVTDRPRDLKHDHLVVTGGGGPSIEKSIETPFALVNGSTAPAPLHLTAGETHRLRLVSINPDWAIRYTLRNLAVTARWRAIAKDGADLPRALATMRTASVLMGPGETADFAFTPSTPGTWRLDVASDGAGWQIPLQVIVDPAPKRNAKASSSSSSSSAKP